jgi:ClpP class serine protease
MALWLMEKEAMESMREWRGDAVKLTAEDLTAVLTASAAKQLVTATGSVGEIQIQGVLTNKPDFMAAIFGGGNTTYTDIINAVHAADADPAIKKTRFVVNSPGGEINGLFEAMDTIAAAKKPSETFVEGMAASAAYGLISQTDKIVAQNRSTLVGSVGIVSVQHVSENIVATASTEAPEKVNDVTTEEGQANERKLLDGIHAIFAKSIADGRGTNIKDVNANFGRGGLVLANEAKAAGMIDKITSKPKKTVAIGADKLEEKRMDLQELKTQHAAVYDAAVAIGHKQGMEAAQVHATYALESGLHESALKAIKAGEAVTEVQKTEHIMAAAKGAKLEAFTADNPDAGAPKPKTEATPLKALDDATAALIEDAAVEDFDKMEAPRG